MAPESGPIAREINPDVLRASITAARAEGSVFRLTPKHMSKDVADTRSEYDLNKDGQLDEGEVRCYTL